MVNLLTNGYNKKSIAKTKTPKSCGDRCAIATAFWDLFFIAGHKNQKVDAALRAASTFWFLLAYSPKG